MQNDVICAQFNSRVKSFFVRALNLNIMIARRCNLQHMFTENLRLSEVLYLVVTFAFL